MAVVAMGGLALAAIMAFVTGSPTVFVVGFVATWVLSAIGIFLYHLANVLGGGVPDREHSGQVFSSSGDGQRDRSDRLDELKSLHDRGLISGEEYTARKEEILAEI